jgi:hypothetical protein
LGLYLYRLRFSIEVIVTFGHADNYYVFESSHRADVGSVTDVSEVTLPTSIRVKIPYGRFNINSEETNSVALSP